MKNKKNVMNEELKEIIIERLKSMPEELKVSLGVKKGFLNKEEIIENIEEETDTGIEIYTIQVNHLLSLKKGIILSK